MWRKYDYVAEGAAAPPPVLHTSWVGQTNISLPVGLAKFFGQKAAAKMKNKYVSTYL